MTEPTIQRYSPKIVSSDASMEPDEKGGWVTYADFAILDRIVKMYEKFVPSMPCYVWLHEGEMYWKADGPPTSPTDGTILRP